MDQNNKEYIIGIQSLRGLAAFSVLLCHYGSSLKNPLNLGTFLNYGQLGVYVFFFISGYIVVSSLLKYHYHTKDFLKFLTKRSIRIEPVYIVTIICTLLTYWILSHIPTFKGDPIPFISLQFLSHIFYLIPFTKWDYYNHVFWTLGIEFQFYILIGVVYFLNRTPLFRFIFLILFSLTSFIQFEKSYFLLTTYSPVFAMGIATLHYQQTKNKCYLLSLLISGIITYINFDLTIVLLILLSTAVILLQKRTYKLLNFMGRISYSLYLIHPLVLVIITGIIKKLIPSYQQHEILVLCIQLLFALIIANLLYSLIEKPAIALSKKISYK